MLDTELLTSFMLSQPKKFIKLITHYQAWIKYYESYLSCLNIKGARLPLLPYTDKTYYREMNSFVRYLSFFLDHPEGKTAPSQVSYKPNREVLYLKAKITLEERRMLPVFKEDLAQIKSLLRPIQSRSMSK